MVDVDRLNTAKFQHLCLLVDRKFKAITVPYTGIYAQRQQNQESLVCVQDQSWTDDSSESHIKAHKVIREILP